jgi:hypothetical protein
MAELKEVVEDQNEIVIENTEPTEPSEKFDTEGLTDGEIEMAKRQGLIKEEEDGEHEEQPEPATEEDTGSEEEQEEEIEEPSFEQVEENEKLIDKYNKNEKALYWRWKADKQKRQAAQSELEELKASQELQTLKESVSAKKLSAINEALEDPDLTVEKLQAIIAGKTFEPKEEKRYTLAEIEEMKQAEAKKQEHSQKQMQQRFMLTEQIGRSKYDDFDKMVELVQEAVNEDKTGVTQKVLNQSLFDTNIDEADLADVIVRFAQLNPKFKEVTNKATPSDKEKVNRAIENSKKKKSSASIAGSGKRIITNEEDLTPEDAAKMDNKQWMKLRPSTRKRLLMGG